MTDEERKLFQRFDYLKPSLRNPDEWESFLEDLNVSIAALKHERDDDLFVIKETAVAEIKKVQAIRVALLKVSPAEAEDLWSSVDDLLPIGLHELLIQDCGKKLNRDGAQGVAGKGDALKKLRRTLKALKNEAVIDSLWLSLPGQSGCELHQQLLADCSEWVSRADSHEAARVALTDAVVGMAISLAKRYLNITISTGSGAPFIRFTDDVCGRIFSITGVGQGEGEYSRDTFRTHVRKYLAKNETISTPQE